MTVVAQQAGGTNKAEYGLIFRINTFDDLYYFGIYNDCFKLSIKYASDWARLIKCTPSPAIRPNEPNRLGVIAQGKHFTLLINDQIVGEITDDRIRRGQIGLAIQVHGTDLQVTFEFDNFELRVPYWP